MKFKFIGNAGGIFTGSNGTRILCDFIENSLRITKKYWK
jgi:hypothetical protein